MKIWLYLIAEGLPQASSDWPCCYWSDATAPQVMPLAQAATAMKGHSITLILPMEACSWWITDKWPSRGHPGAKALAYAIEDQLAQELETLHIAIGKVDSSQRYPILVIDRQRLDELLSLLKSLKIEPTSLHVDADLLPQDQPCGAWWFGRWIVGGTLNARLALTDEARENLRESFAPPVLWLNKPSDELTVLSALLSKHSREAIDLRQGQYDQERQPWPWRLFSATLAATFVLTLGFTLVRSHFLEQEAARLYANSVEHFRMIYPEQNRIVDLSAQLRSLQSRGRQTDVTQLARLLKLADQVIGGSGGEVQRIEYRTGEGWKVQLTADSFAELELMRERGKQSGMPIKIGNASKEQHRVRAVLTLMESS